MGSLSAGHGFAIEWEGGGSEPRLDPSRPPQVGPTSNCSGKWWIRVAVMKQSKSEQVWKARVRM